MAQKFHVGENGPGLCEAEKRACPVKGDHGTEAEMTKLWEARMEAEHDNGSISKVDEEVEKRLDYYRDCEPVAFGRSFEEFHPKVLNALAKDERLPARLAVAYSAHTPRETLDELANSRDEEVRIAVAYNERTPQETLERLSWDSSVMVRSKVASNDRVSPEILHKLSDDPETVVRKGVASNVKTSQATLQKLLGQKDTAVNLGLGLNPDLSPELLDKIVDHGGGYEELWTVADHSKLSLQSARKLMKNKDSKVRKLASRKLPEAEFNALADDEAGEVREHVAMRTKDIAILEKLSKDSDPTVRSKAEENLKKRVAN